MKWTQYDGQKCVYFCTPYDLFEAQTQNGVFQPSSVGIFVSTTEEGAKAVSKQRDFALMVMLKLWIERYDNVSKWDSKYEEHPFVDDIYYWRLPTKGIVQSRWESMYSFPFFKTEDEKVGGV